MSIIDLIPCPYCGGNAGISSVDGRYMPHCYTPNCIMEVAPSFQSAEEAAAAWNRRAVTRSKWIGFSDKGVFDMKCAVCGCTIPFGQNPESMRYCYHCGAEMEES